MAADAASYSAKNEAGAFAGTALSPAFDLDQAQLANAAYVAPDIVGQGGSNMLRSKSIPQKGWERSALQAHFAIPSANRSIASMIPAHVLALALLLGVGAQARADDPHLGIIEYEISCMPCHGVDGHGDGRLARSLPTRPLDLTRITKSNGGEFPSAKVADIIDGRAIVAVHGPREMPVWGDRYRKAIEPNEPPAMIERRARAQIAALVKYIETIQAK